MKSLHVPFVFYPDAVGGTEVYVAALAASLNRQHHPAVVAAPAKATSHYMHGSTPVHRFATAELVPNPIDLYSEGDPEAAEVFGRILDRERPEVVHLHAFTRACSVLLVRQAHSRGIPVVFTYHTPTASCARGTLMLWGDTPCDGTLDVSRCSACALEAQGVPKPIAHVLSHLPASSALAAARLRGRAGTALRFSSLMALKHSATRALFTEVERIVAFRKWVRALLVANGVAGTKIVSSTHALCHPVTARRRIAKRSGPLRIAFLGRLDPTKGVDILIRALRETPRTEVLLDIYGTTQGDAGQRERDRLRGLADGDTRIFFKTPLDAAAVVETLVAYDALAVPSQWMETGPLVVLEAFAAGIPIIGSALGGITELVADGVNGLLIRNHRSPTEWAAAFNRLATQTGLVETLASNVTAPRSMDEVATEMISVYESLLRPAARSVSTISSVA